MVIKKIVAFLIDGLIVLTVALNVGAVWLYISTMRELFGSSPLPFLSNVLALAAIWIGLAILLTSVWSYFTIKGSIGKYLLNLSGSKRNILWFTRTAIKDVFICFIILISVFFAFYRDAFLIYATAFGGPKSVNTLLTLGTNPNVNFYLNKKQFTLPIISVQNLDVLKVVLSKGGDPNAADENGKTVLMYVVERGLIEQVKVLLAAGADKSKRDNEGNTALDYAVKKGLTTFRPYLE